MAVTKAIACVREQVDNFTNATTTYLIHQGIANHTAVFISKVVIFLLTINLPLVLVALTLFASVLISFLFGAVAMLLACLLSLTVTLVLGFFVLSLIMSCAFTVVLFTTISTIASCAFACTVGLAIALIGANVTTRLAKVRGQSNNTNHTYGPVKAPAESGATSSTPEREVPDSRPTEQKDSTIISNYSGSG